MLLRARDTREASPPSRRRRRVEDEVRGRDRHRASHHGEREGAEVADFAEDVIHQDVDVEALKFKLHRTHIGRGGFGVPFP